MSNPKLIVGLGNPGAKYTWTRHNLGFLVLEALAAQQKILWRSSSVNQGVLARIVLEGVECSLLLPTTFMNNSGTAVKKLAVKQGIPLKDILIVCDDLDLPFGKLRLRPSGSAGGHNGLKSIIEHLGSNQFARLRMGINAPGNNIETVDYVLSNFTAAEKKSLAVIINHALDCVTSWVTEGAEVAMGKFNKNNEVK